MKVLAQHGHQPSDKITKGIEQGLIKGGVFSARCLSPDRANERLGQALDLREGVEILLDPEFFASRMAGSANAQLGYLEAWGYLRSFRRRELVRSEVVEEVLRTMSRQFSGLPVTSHISPNIYISQSFDSMEAGISLNFIERAKGIYGDLGLPVLATLAIDRRALLNRSEFFGFLNDLTALQNPPDGFYLLIGGGAITERSDSAQSEIIDAEVIGGWMTLNFVLSSNGFKVVNGYADVLTPFLAAAGADACATGWWTNLRTFSMGRYARAAGGGGQPPLIRYLSKLLLNRIRKDELSFVNLVPEILNGLPLDEIYNGSPGRTDEALQTWEALSSLNEDVKSSSIEDALSKLSAKLDRAAEAYAKLSAFGISARYDTSIEYLEQLKGGDRGFQKTRSFSRVSNRY